MYYFFGAGNNCSGALKFFGKENVVAIIDNSDIKVGTLFEGVPILAFDELKKKYRGETIIITAYIKSDEIICQLKEAGILNYYVCPYMQSGFWSVEKIVNMGKLAENCIFAVYEKNPVTEAVIQEISKQRDGKFNVAYLCEEERILGSEIEADVLLIASEVYVEYGIFHGCKKIFDLYREMAAARKISYGYLQQYKDIHKGETCFVLGNGPSLRIEDLEKIHSLGVVSMASNGIYRIFGDTEWRPHYYVIGDAIVYGKNKDKLPTDMTYFMRDFCGMSDSDKNTVWYNSKGEKFYPGYPKFSDDLAEGVYGGRTVTYDMLQIAVYMGFKKIYLIGVDFSYGEEGRSTHFYHDAKDDMATKLAVGYRDEIEHAYISARQYAEEHDIKIYNATRGGYLEVFERRNLDEVLNEITDIKKMR